MNANDITIAPAPPAPEAPVSPSPTPSPAAESAPQDEGGGAIPPEVLKFPPMMAVLAGQPPAISTLVANKDERLLKIWQGRENLAKAGIAFYRSLAGDIGVIFNSLRLDPETLKQADRAGKLLEVAPPYDQVETGLAGKPLDLENVQAPEGFPQKPAPETPQAAQSPVSPPSAGAQKAIATKRLAALQPKEPTEGLKPGAGRVLNAILTPNV
jgi:hypothetical protein